jgi:hypothetical protein
MGSFLTGTLTVVAIIYFYFLPTITAGEKFKKDTKAIFFLNLVLGWTVLGWIVAMVWAITNDTRR